MELSHVSLILSARINYSKTYLSRTRIAHFTSLPKVNSTSLGILFPYKCSPFNSKFLNSWRYKSFQGNVVLLCLSFLELVLVQQRHIANKCHRSFRMCQVDFLFRLFRNRLILKNMKNRLGGRDYGKWLHSMHITEVWYWSIIVTFLCTVSITIRLNMVFLQLKADCKNIVNDGHVLVLH